MKDRSPSVDECTRSACFVAFAEALEQWEKVEDELILLYGNLGWSPDFNQTWEVFVSAQGFREQRRMLLDLALHALGHGGKKRVDGLLRQLRRHADSRNRIVHGIWRVVWPLNSDATADGHRTLRRDYRHPDHPGGFMPTTENERDALRKDRMIFYIEDLWETRDALKAFRSFVAREREQMIRAVAPRIRL